MNAEYHLTVDPGMCTVVSYGQKTHVSLRGAGTPRDRHTVCVNVSVSVRFLTHGSQPIVDKVQPFSSTGWYIYGVLVGHTALQTSVEDEATAAPTFDTLKCTCLVYGVM